MPVLTLTPDTLIVQSAYPDPPFDIMENGTATGFDIELMRHMVHAFLRRARGWCARTASP